METVNVLAVNIQKALDVRGLKALHLSMDSRVPQARISDILLGKVLNPQINTVLKLARALDMSLDELVGDHGLDVSRPSRN